MYTAIIVLIMGVLPVVSIVLEPLLRPDAPGFVALVGRWFVFWAVGVRLGLAGLKQVSDPGYTAKGILGVADSSASVVVRELGFANLATGVVGLLSLAFSGWVLPAAVAGALFLGLAGINHALRGAHTGKETVAMVSDLAIALVLAAYIVATALGA